MSPLFRCQKCDAVENTALGKFWCSKEKLCSKCWKGKWHDNFPKEKYDSKRWISKRGFLELRKNEKRKTNL